MAFGLRTAGHDGDWVADLSPAQLTHYHAMMIRARSVEQLETLHIQVSAAAVTADGGKAAKKQDSALRDAARRPTVPVNKPVVGRAPTLDELSGIERENAKTDHLWR